MDPDFSSRALLLYSELRSLYQKEDVEINGADLVEAIGLCVRTDRTSFFEGLSILMTMQRGERP